MNERFQWRHWGIYLMLPGLMLGGWFIGTPVSFAGPAAVNVQDPLARAKVYLAAGDYRRAVEACQMNVDQSPSVESYVYLIYVYHALNGYLEWLAQRDEWVKVGSCHFPWSIVERWILPILRIYWHEWPKNCCTKESDSNTTLSPAWRTGSIRRASINCGWRNKPGNESIPTTGGPASPSNGTGNAPFGSGLMTLTVSSVAV